MFDLDMNLVRLEHLIGAGGERLIELVLKPHDKNKLYSDDRPRARHPRVSRVREAPQLQNISDCCSWRSRSHNERTAPGCTRLVVRRPRWPDERRKSHLYRLPTPRPDVPSTVLQQRMALSPAELRQQSEVLLAHGRQVRRDAERARQHALQCRERADAARIPADLGRHHSQAAQGRQDER